MASIQEIIQQHPNPFDNFYTGDFWQEEQDYTLTVDSIHQQEITQIENFLEQVSSSNRPRTILLTGDSGSGKSYLLSRLKHQLNQKAFFVYINPWPDSNYIWRHILRQTVDGLQQIPEHQTESQLLLLLKEQQKTTNIYHAREFFRVLLMLGNPELYELACEWLRGDDLEEEDLEKLGVRNAIDSEDAAQKILLNFGKIAAPTQPIVLCFDQLDNIPRLANGDLDLQALFNVNTMLHNVQGNHFLIIISIITNTWRENQRIIQPADKARITEKVQLKPITLEQAAALWASRLYSLHQQVNPQPKSPIYPFNVKALEKKFSRSKTDPRNALLLGRNLFQIYKKHYLGCEGEIRNDPVEEFKLIWQKKYQEEKQKITQVRNFSAPELLRMMQEVLAALQVGEIKPNFLSFPSKYASYFLGYKNSHRVGLVWSEEPNLTSFFHLMNACKKALQKNLCQSLYLIRGESVGKPQQKCNQIYRQIFTNSEHQHLKCDLTSVYYLATYHSLVNASRELVVAGKTPDLPQFQALMRESKILENCPLLQDLGIVQGEIIDPDQQELRQVEQFLFSMVKTQQMLALQILRQNTVKQFEGVKEAQVEAIIQQLCQENKIVILGENDSRIVCLKTN